MEIKITISDTGAGGTVSMQINGESVGTGIESSSGGQQIIPSLEILRAAGAIDAGRAPSAAGSTQPGAPIPFSSGSNLGDVMTSPGIWAGPYNAAIPDSGSVVEMVIGPGEQR
ncbi:MAG TPA: hypothetical protein VN843_13115 [Anaerolineales bacterium]|nr:hypothetical protein [Anaerolineales bacterium]